MSAICFMGLGVNWRIYEKEMFEKYFGQAYTIYPPVLGPYIKQDVIFWKLNSESLHEGVLATSLNVSQENNTIPQINSPWGWMSVHCKERAFKIWRDNNILHPSWYIIDKNDDRALMNPKWFPCLYRLNNSTAGRHSYMCHDGKDALIALMKLQEDMEATAGVPRSMGIGRKRIAVRYHDTGTEEYNMSFRIIVAGNRVIVGYARLSPKNDWCCITKKFNESMKQSFIWAQQKCWRFCQAYEKEIVKAVRCLRLNFQGVDVIIDRETGQHLFIEVQPGFSVGYANRPGWNPPFYNPSAPKELVEWLIKDEKNIRNLMPWYYEMWLDKRAMFDASFKALKESFNETPCT